MQIVCRIYVDCPFLKSRGAQSRNVGIPSHQILILCLFLRNAMVLTAFKTNHSLQHRRKWSVVCCHFYNLNGNVTLALHANTKLWKTKTQNILSMSIVG
jgi:hypothetical protein